MVYFQLKYLHMTFPLLLTKSVYKREREKQTRPQLPLSQKKKNLNTMWGRARRNSYSAIALPNLSVCTAHSSILSPEFLVTIATHWLTVSMTASEVVPIFIRRPFMLSDYWRTVALTVSLTYHQSIVLPSSRKNTFSLPAASCCQTFPLLEQVGPASPLRLMTHYVSEDAMPQAF